MTDQIEAEKPTSAAKPPAEPARPEPGKRKSAPRRDESMVTRLMRKGSDEADALLETLGMRSQLSGEGQDLARLVERRLAQVNWGTHAQALEQLDIQRSFLVHRFIRPLKRFERDNRGYSYLDNFLNFVSILAGVGASLSAARDLPKAWPIVLGLVVGLLQSISQWLKPAQRATRRGLAASDLRSEMWAFLQGRERYRGKDDKAAWSLLCDQVERVEERESADQDQEAANVHESYRLPS